MKSALSPYSSQIAEFSHIYDFMFSMMIKEKERNHFSFLSYLPLLSS